MGNAITKEEAAAVEEFKSQREAEAEARRLAERSIEDVYIDAFTGYTEGTEEPPHLMEAFATIAAFFHNDDPTFQDGETDPNNAQFNQKGLMGNLCQQADWMLQREERRLGYLRGAVGRAQRNHRSGEIDELELRKVELDYGRSKAVNIPILEDFLVAAKAAFVAQFGEEWRRPVKAAPSEATERDLNATFEKAAVKRRF